MDHSSLATGGRREDARPLASQTTATTHMLSPSPFPSHERHTCTTRTTRSSAGSTCTFGWKTTSSVMRRRCASQAAERKQDGLLLLLRVAGEHAQPKKMTSQITRAGCGPAQRLRATPIIILRAHAEIPCLSPQLCHLKHRPIATDGVGNERQGREDLAAPSPVAGARRSRPGTTQVEVAWRSARHTMSLGCRSRSYMATTASPQAPFPNTGRPRRTESNSTWRRSHRM